jgi:hypothetical protein
MIKFLAAVLVLTTSLCSFAYTPQLGEFSTKNIVRTKLWYDGIDLDSSLIDRATDIELPEEIDIPLKSLEQDLMFVN